MVPTGHVIVFIHAADDLDCAGHGSVNQVVGQNLTIVFLGDLKPLVQRFHEREKCPEIAPVDLKQLVCTVLRVVKTPIEHGAFRVFLQIAPIGDSKRSALVVDGFDLIPVRRGLPQRPLKQMRDFVVDLQIAACQQVRFVFI